MVTLTCYILIYQTIEATFSEGEEIDYDDDDYDIRTRLPNTVVALKVPNVPDWSGNSNNITVEFLNEVTFKSKIMLAFNCLYTPVS